MINGKLEYRVLLRCKRLTAWCRMKHVCNHVSVAFFAYQVELCFHHGLRHLQATPWFSFANLPSPLLRMNNVSTHLSILIQEQWSVLAVMPVQVLLTECQDLCSHPNWSYLWCILKGNASEGLYADGRTHAHTHTLLGSASLPQRPRRPQDLAFGFFPPKSNGKRKAKATKNINNNNNK